MDPEILLDYALFQLTPTRTRCDLVVFSGGISEKLASGLVEPFTCHLKFAKDEIPKGGYSITLSPPPSTHSSCFTKATFQRLVRFINTPEILERFVRIEQEISQIEDSVQSDELSTTNIAAEGSLQAAGGITNKSTDSSKFKGFIGGANDVTQENSKVRLQRILETRKALLRKEQAMAYARALVAGFEMDNMDNLILFADNFGASRFREACTDFKELCKRKLKDVLWMDELATMTACSGAELSYSGTSGIILTCESSASSQNNMLNFHSNLVSTAALVPNGSLDASCDLTTSQSNLEGNKVITTRSTDQIPSTPAKVQGQIPWRNQIPQYMYNFQRPSIQKIPQYHGYPYPGMPPYYAFQPPDQHPYHKSSSMKKEKSPKVKEPETSDGEEEQIQTSDSWSVSDAVSKKPIIKKHRKKSSKTVVIRNINYITSKRRNGGEDGISDSSSSFEDEFIDEDSLKEKVDGAVASLEKQHKSKSRNNKKRESQASPSIVNGSNGEHNESWDALQNLLIRDEELKTTTSTTSGVKELQTDSFVVSERVGENEGRVNLEDCTKGGEIFHPRIKTIDRQFIISRGLEESENNVQKMLSDFVTESSIIRNKKGGDWFVATHSGISESQDKTFDEAMFDERENFHLETSKKNAVPIDDSFMVQARSSLDDQYDTQWRTDISMVSDFSVPESGTPDNSQVKVGDHGSHEPDDLCIVLVRDSGSGSVWTPKMDYGSEILFTKADKKSAPVESHDHIERKLPTNPKSANVKKDVAKAAKSIVLQGSVSMSKKKKATHIRMPMVQKSKLEKEEESRKRMEELVIERQKRIAERSAADPAASKRIPVGANGTNKLCSPKVVTKGRAVPLHK